MNKLTCFAILLLLFGQYRPASAQCSAAFTYAVGSNKTVSFYASDSNGIQHRWLFGDGSSVSTTSFAVTHTYAQAGQYLVTDYTERPGANCHDSVKTLITIPADTCSIMARFQYGKDSFDCKKIHFINYSVPISPNVHFAWNFGDGSSSTDISPVHTYAQAGAYLVSLVSEAGANCRRQVWDTVYVNCTDSCPYATSFSWKADSVTTGKIYFSNLSQSAVAGVHYTWNFGDSSAQSHDVSPAHTYARPGNYTVCLVAELGSHCRKVYCATIEVKEISHCTTKAAFGYYKLNWLPITIRLEALNQGDSAKYYWSFGDSSYGNGRLTTHSYAKGGWYTVCLQVISGKCSTTGCQPVFVADSVLNLPQLVQAVPNPAINSVAINVTLDRPETVIIRILDGTGVIKAVFSKNGTTGNNRFTLPVERLSRGLYLVEIHTSTRQWFSRFQKG